MLLENLSKEQQLTILGLILVIVSGLGVMTYRHFAPSTSEEIMIEEPQQGRQVRGAGEIVVHVVGEVKHEGVYRLRIGDRIIDALKLAGGASQNADLSSINLAEKIKDGQRVIIPAKQIASVDNNFQGGMGSGGGGRSSGKVNINSASEKELCKVSGIGKTTAQRIIEYRSTKGPFAKIEDIMKVKNIGKSKFGKIKDEITI